MINTLTNTDPNTNHEIMVYGLGTVKLLAGNPKIREELSQNELCVKLLSDCLQKCTEVQKIYKIFKQSYENFRLNSIKIQLLMY